MGTATICPNEAEGPPDVDCLGSLLPFVRATGLLHNYDVRREWVRRVGRGGVACSLLKCTLEEGMRAAWERAVCQTINMAESTLGCPESRVLAFVPGNFLGAVGLLLPISCLLRSQ